MPKDNLYSSVSLGALNLPNRIIMAPLTRSRADADHVPTAIIAEYYAQRASAGLIVAEATMAIEGNSAFGGREPGIYAEAQVAAWQQVTGGARQGRANCFANLARWSRLSFFAEQRSPAGGPQCASHSERHDAYTQG